MRTIPVLVLAAILGFAIYLHTAAPAGPSQTAEETGAGDTTPRMENTPYLSDAERLRLFDLERADLLLGKALSPWTSALAGKRAADVRRALRDGFQASVPSLAPALAAARTTAGAYGFAQAEGESSLDADAFIAWLESEVWPGFKRIAKAKLGRKFNSAEILDGSAAEAHSTGTWLIAGEAAGGGWLELSGTFVLGHAGLVSGEDPGAGWIHRLELAATRVIASPRHLFREVTKATGIDTDALHDNWDEADLANGFHIHPGGAYAGDVDMDGHLDLVVTDRGRSWLYLGDGTGFFRDAGWSPPTRTERPTYVAIFDATGDGRTEVLHGGRLYRWEPTKRTMEPVAGADEIPQGDMALCDYDLDGLVDVYILESGRNAPPQTTRAFFDDERISGKENRLFRNLGKGKFQETTELAGASGEMGRTFAAVWFYANDDKWPDLFAANEFGRNVFLLNNGDGTFRELPEIDAEFGGYSMGAASGDLNGDGRADLYVSNMYSKAGHRVFHHIPMERYPADAQRMFMASVKGNKYYRNIDGSTFSDDSITAGVNVAGWGWSGAIADFDLDGRLDVYAPCGHTSSDKAKPDG